MHKLQAHMNPVKSTALALFIALFAVALVATAPFVRADGEGDSFDCCTGSSYIDSYPVENSYVDSYPVENSYVDSYPVENSYIDSYPSNSSSGGIAYAGAGASFGGYASFSPFGSVSSPYRASTPYSTYSPYVAPTRNTTTVRDNGNTIDSYNSCVHPGSCSTTTDNHSVVNANTTINSPVTISTINPAPQNTQIVYNTPTPQPYILAPTCNVSVSQGTYGQSYILNWTSANATSGWINGIGSVATVGSTVIHPSNGASYTATFTGTNGQTVTCSAVATAQPRIVYNTAHAAAVPYVTLSQVPYTGLDLGPAGIVVYWSFLVLACLFMAYLIVVKRAHLVLAATLKSVIFGTEDEHSDDVTPADSPRETPMAEYTASQKPHDAIDEFIMTQINRA